jgi:hypothetical protein
MWLASPRGSLANFMHISIAYDLRDFEEALASQADRRAHRLRQVLFHWGSEDLSQTDHDRVLANHAFSVAETAALRHPFRIAWDVPIGEGFRCAGDDTMHIVFGEAGLPPCCSPRFDGRILHGFLAGDADTRECATLVGPQ